MKRFAPILLFTFSRVNSLRRLIKSLKENKESKYYELYIFSDGAKKTKDFKQVKPQPDRSKPQNARAAAAAAAASTAMFYRRL